MGFELIPDFPGPPHGTATCFTCHKPRYDSHEKIIDLGVITDEVQDLDGNLHGYTKPAMCESCVNALIALVGGYDPKTAQRLRDTVMAAEGRAEQYRLELEKLKRAVKEVSV